MKSIGGEFDWLARVVRAKSRLDSCSPGSVGGLFEVRLDEYVQVLEFAHRLGGFSVRELAEAVGEPYRVVGRRVREGERRLAVLERDYGFKLLEFCSVCGFASGWALSWCKVCGGETV